MKSILRATAVLSSASVMSILTGLVSAKVTAVLLGPGGVGYMGLLQSLLGLSALIVSMGLGVGLVRAGARALAQHDERQETALRDGAWLLSWTLGGVGLLVMIMVRGPLSHFMLGGPQHKDAVIITAVALLLTLASGVQVSILNAHHRVGDLARVGILNSIFGVGAVLLIIWGWRERGIAWTVLATSATNFLVSCFYVRSRTPRAKVRLAAHEVWRAAGSLLRFGGPYTASMLAGMGVQLALPVLVLHALGTNDVGFYRAATGVSLTYIGFLITAMAQDYYPRVSAAGDQPAALNRLINEQCRLVLLLAGPIIIGMLALVPWLVPLIYSPLFFPAVALLEWQLIGDIFKYVAWTMSFVILARSGSLVFFFIEAVGGASMLLFSSFGMHWFGLPGIGMGFVLCTVIYYLLCWAILRRSISLRWTTTNKLMFIALLAAALVIRVLPYLGFERARTPVALILAASTGLVSLYLIQREVGGWKGMLALRKAT